jgi:glycosyltransferase involved in cell wall biosynthesis
MRLPLATILINNCNYSAFLSQAVESCLDQTYENVEVVVVDDGSTDASREIIKGFGERVRPVLKENGGQASALNAGIEASKGEIIFFLDADDFCHPQRVEKLVQLWLESDPDRKTSALMFHPQRFCDRNGNLKRKRFPPRLVRMQHYQKGIRDDRFGIGAMAVLATPRVAADFLRSKSYLPFLTSATSGMALTRPMADKLFPIPEEGIFICADSFISLGALLEGPVVLLNEELSYFRMHGKNRYMISRKRPNADLFFNQRDHYLNMLARRQGLPEVILTLDNWERVRRYLKNKPLREILKLLVRAETHQYMKMLARRGFLRIQQRLYQRRKTVVGQVEQKPWIKETRA